MSANASQSGNNHNLETLSNELEKPTNVLDVNFDIWDHGIIAHRGGVRNKLLYFCLLARKNG
jgi:hypothetical protein